MSSTGRQIPLPLKHTAADDEGNFLVSEANREAVAYLHKWPDWPLPTALLLGERQCGKSHLATIFAKRTAARVIDDLDRTLDEEWLFHIWNEAKSSGSPLLLVARTQPAAWDLHLRDLKSRLAATPQLWIHAPDDALLEGVMLKQFRDRGLLVDREVLAYLVPRIERTFAACAEIVQLLDESSMSKGREITIPLSREVLASLAPPTMPGD